MKKRKGTSFFKYFLWGMVLTWLILTAGIALKGQLLRLFSRGHLLLVLGIYLLAGFICGSCFAAFLLLLKKK